MTSPPFIQGRYCGKCHAGVPERALRCYRCDPAPGPWRIISTPSGDWCDECYRDTKDQTDHDFNEMANMGHKLDGTCVCCNGRIVAGELLDRLVL